MAELGTLIKIPTMYDERTSFLNRLLLLYCVSLYQGKANVLNAIT